MVLTQEALRRRTNSLRMSCSLLAQQDEKPEKKDGRMTLKDKQAKWEAISRVGVFVGYDMKPGYEWSRRYFVWDLDAFQNADLFATTEKCLKRIPPRTRYERSGSRWEGYSFRSKKCT